MKTIPLFLLFAPAAFAQVVQLTPTNYSMTVSVQNNLGKLASSWIAESEDRVDLGARILVVTHTAYFRGAYSGAAGGRQLIDRSTYYQIGGTIYRPVGAESIRLFAQKATGGWVGSTNFIPAAEMATVSWNPTVVGTITIGDRYHRIVTTASPLVLNGRNIANRPYVVRFRCASGGQGFTYDFRFDANQRREITLSVTGANSFLSDPINNYFECDMDNAIEEQL